MPRRKKGEGWGPGTCPVCTHPKVGEIDEMLRDKSLKVIDVANAFSIKPEIVYRHRNVHLGIKSFEIKRKIVRRDDVQKVVVVNRGARLSTQLPAPSLGAAGATTGLRDLSKTERNAIRDQLDDKFDSERGAYIAGWSDQKIGEALNIPWRHVYNIRELAYGSINEHPLQSKLDSLDTRIAEIEIAVKQLRGQLDQLRNQLIGGKRHA